MKTCLVTLIFICNFGIVVAEPAYLPEVVRVHQYKDCLFIDVRLRSDNGTPDNPDDDTIVGTSTVNSCEIIPEDIDPDHFTIGIFSYNDPSSGCTFHLLKVSHTLNKEFEASGAASLGCY